jgi:hypothetical protein
VSRRLVVTTGIAGVLVAIAGVGVLASRAAREAGFGWFAYAPVSQEQLDSLVAVNGARVLGAVLVAAGLVLVALAAGARAARAGARPGSLRGVGVVGGLIVVVGLVTLLRPRTLVALGDEPPVSTSSTLLPVQVVGLVVALVGVLLLAGVLGALAARPRAESASG